MVTIDQLFLIFTFIVVFADFILKHAKRK